MKYSHSIELQKLFNPNKILIVILFLKLTCFTQDWETAPEIWSEPVLLDSVFSNPNKMFASPSLNRSLDTLYLERGDGIYLSTFTNDKWSIPIKLSDNVNAFSAAVRNSSLSKDGNRIYYSAYAGYGSWDIWYSDWNSTLKDWAQAQNMGSSINSEGLDLYVYEKSKDTLFAIQSWQHLNMYKFDSLKNDWILADEFPTHDLGGITMFGLSMTEDGKKLYCGKDRWEDEWGIDLCVAYWDSTINYWGDVYYLNINTQTVPWKLSTKRGGEYDPWISPDGKMMIFSSNRNAPLHPDSSGNLPDLYVSYLLVDEHGDTVTSVKNQIQKSQLSYTLNQNYPNPFNPVTKIKFTIPANTSPLTKGGIQGGLTKLSVFDALGCEVSVLVNEQKPPGTYEVEFDGSGLVSGVYFYRLTSGSYSETKKMVLLR